MAHIIHLNAFYSHRGVSGGGGHGAGGAGGAGFVHVSRISTYSIFHPVVNRIPADQEYHTCMAGRRQAHLRDFLLLVHQCWIHIVNEAVRLGFWRKGKKESLL